MILHRLFKFMFTTALQCIEKENSWCMPLWNAFKSQRKMESIRVQAASHTQPRPSQPLYFSQQMEVMFYDRVRASKWLPYASACSLTLPTQRCLESGISHGHVHRGSERVNRLSKGPCVQETRLVTHLSSSAVRKRESVCASCFVDILFI